MPPPGHVPPHDGQSGYGQYGHQPDDYYGQQPGYAQQPWYGQDPGYGRQGYPQAGYGSGYPPSGDRPTRT
jgi:hypothetical protein